VKPEPDADDNPISSGQKRKALPVAGPSKNGSKVIVLGDTSEDNDDEIIEIVSRKPSSYKKPKIADNDENTNRRSSTMFNKNAPLARTGSNASSTSIRDEQKPIIASSSSSPVRPPAANVLSPKISQRSIPDLSASSPSGRMKTEEEIATERQLRRAEERCRVLRQKTRSEPGRAVLTLMPFGRID
jgi:hypothetical protein